MALEQLSNDAQSTTTGSVDGTSDPVSITVTDASKFPSKGNFRILIDSEILLVTAVSGSTFTCSRAQENTTISTHSSSATVTHIVTAGSLKQYIKEKSWSPYPLFVPGVYDDEFDDENFSGWTAVGTSPVVTTVEKNDKLSCYHPGSDAAAKWYAFMKSCPVGTNQYIETCFRCEGNGQNYPMVGLFLSDGTTFGSGNQINFYYSITEQALILANYTGFNAIVSSTFVNDNQGFRNSHLFLRLTNLGSGAYKGEFSPDGVQWVVVNTGLSGQTLTTPSYAGFGFSKWGGDKTFVASLEYWRKGP